MKKIQIFDALRDLIPFVHTKTIIPPWVFFTFLKLYKWYQIAQRTTYLNISRTKRIFLIQ